MRETPYPAKEISRSQENHTYTRYHFPSDIGSHGILLLFKDYSYEGTMGLNIGKPSGNLRNGVMLPLPTNLVDNISINVGSEGKGAIGSLILDMLGSPASDAARMENFAVETMKMSYDTGKMLGSSMSSGDYGQAIGSITAMASTTERAMKYFGRNIGDQIMPGAGVAMDVASGTTINPHLTLDFDGVGMKKHSFSWLFSPKNMEETNQLREIITLFKRESHPEYKSVTGSTDTASSLSRGLLTYPSLVDIFFVGVNPGYFYYFKPTMITNISVNYAPNGVAINRDGSPAVVSLQVDVQEASIFTRGDFK